jgi:Uma2 family endonuclease
VEQTIQHCLAHGIQMGWLIDPEERSVIIIGLGQAFEAIDQPNIMLPVPTFAQSIQLTIGDIFGWLQKLKLRKTCSSLSSIYSTIWTRS